MRNQKACEVSATFDITEEESKAQKPQLTFRNDE